MPKLVDLDEIRKDLSVYHYEEREKEDPYYGYNNLLLKDIKQILDIEDIVDAKSVVHAHWITDGTLDGDKNIHCVCSNCGSSDAHASNVVVSYCWHCGAKIDGKEKDND